MPRVSFARAAGSCALWVALALVAAPTWARAALTASDVALADAVLNQFNAVAFGSYAANNETEGRIAVGDGFAGAGHNVCFNGCAGDTTSAALGATYGSLTVWGSVTGSGAVSGGGDFFVQGGNAAGSTLNMNNHGGVAVVGANAGTIQSASFVRTSQASAGTLQNLNAGTPVSTGLPGATVFPFAPALPFQAALSDLAAALPGIAATTVAQTLGPYVQNGATGITAVAAPGSFGGKHYGFVTTSMADLAGYQNFTGVNTNGLDAVFVIVSGQSGQALPGLNANNNETNVIWDFVDAASVSFAGSWYGQILAPNATVSNPAGNLTGAVIAQAIVQSNEFHQLSGNYFLPPGTLSGLPTTPAPGTPVDEPPAGAVLGVGLLGLWAPRRRSARA